MKKERKKKRKIVERCGYLGNCTSDLILKFNLFWLFTVVPSTNRFKVISSARFRVHELIFREAGLLLRYVLLQAVVQLISSCQLRCNSYNCCLQLDPREAVLEFPCRYSHMAGYLKSTAPPVPPHQFHPPHHGVSVPALTGPFGLPHGLDSVHPAVGFPQGTLQFFFVVTSAFSHQKV